MSFLNWFKRKPESSEAEARTVLGQKTVTGQAHTPEPILADLPTRNRAAKVSQAKIEPLSPNQYRQARRSILNRQPPKQGCRSERLKSLSRFEHFTKSCPLIC